MTDIDDSKALSDAADYLELTQESIKGLRAYASNLRQQLAEARNTVDRAAAYALVERELRRVLKSHRQISFDQAGPVEVFLPAGDGSCLDKYGSLIEAVDVLKGGKRG